VETIDKKGRKTVAWKKLDPETVIVVFACGNCGAAATWTAADVDVADDVPACTSCEQPMTFSSVCVKE
jgi:predicted RNA-binding Zn-ribbon protein involved in translation (DUF1610 family)